MTARTAFAALLTGGEKGRDAMDFSYSEQDEALKREVREFVEANWHSPYESHINSVYS